MPESVLGLPLHPLVVHAVVVFVPLAALFVGLAAVLPRFRRWARWMPLAFAAGAFVATPVAASSGESLQAKVMSENLTPSQIDVINQHVTLGNLLVPWSIALFVIAVLIWYGFDHFLRAYRLGDSTIDAELPVWPSKLLVPVSFALLWLRLLVQLAGYVYVLSTLYLGFAPTAAAVVYRWVRHIQPWSMIEILLLGILVSVVKLAGMAEVVTGVSLYAFMILIFTLPAALVAIDERSLWDRFPIAAE